MVRPVCALRQELGARAEGWGKRGSFRARFGFGAVADDETAADREPRFVGERPALRVARQNCIVLGWRGAGVSVSKRIAPRDRRRCAPSGEVERVALARARRRFGGVRIDGVGRFAAQPQDHRRVGAVAFSGEGERAQKRDLDRRDIVDPPEATSPPAKAAAAFIGPTVCDDDGPMPILNSSKMLIIA